MGDKVSSVDCTAFALLCVAFGLELGDLNLPRCRAYVKRMLGLYYPQDYCHHVYCNFQNKEGQFLGTLDNN